MYASPEQRAADIERGSRRVRPPSCAPGARPRPAAPRPRTCDALTAEPVAAPRSSPPRAATVPATEIPWLRAREVMVHAVDLATGVTFADLPADFLAALGADIAQQARRRRSPTRRADRRRPRSPWLAGRSTIRRHRRRRRPRPRPAGLAVSDVHMTTHDHDPPTSSSSAAASAASAAAVALTRKGLAVRVLEQAAEFGEVGAGLQIAPELHPHPATTTACSTRSKRSACCPTSMVMRTPSTAAS